MKDACSGRKRNHPFASVGGRRVRSASVLRRSAPLLALLAATVMVAAGLVGCAGLTFGGHGNLPAKSTLTGTPSTTLRINPTTNGLFCPTQVAWSPDSTRLAILGNAQHCSGSVSGRSPGLIVIYSAASGKVVQILKPETAVLAQASIAQQVMANSAAGGLISTLTYSSLAWTPDGKALLMVFDLELIPSSTPSGDGSSIFGLQRLGVSDSSLTQVWPETSESHHFAPFERWNLVTGVTDVPPSPGQVAAYQWNADGTLAAISPVGRPVGTPDGSKTFSVWQSGQLLFGTESDKATGSTTVLPHDIFWLTNLSPVSPDGHYFYPNMSGFGSIVPPSTQVTGGPVLKSHDQALTALARQMMLTPSPSQNTIDVVAWRPDGSYLAEFAPDATNPNAAAFTTSIYSTVTGKVVNELHPDFSGLSSSQIPNMALSWSPDGTRLLLLDDLFGVLTIWGPGAVPV